MSLSNEQDRFSRLDNAFAKFLGKRTTLDPVKKQRFEFLIARLSYEQHQGHSCIEITEPDKTILLDSELACISQTANPQLFPLVIEENRLYLQRYWNYEDRLATQIKILAQTVSRPSDLDGLLDRYFPVQSDETDWQREAAKLACTNRFSIITGGPGTGKTTTVCKILALLQELADKPLLVALAAPTGKAAMRLQEAVALNLAALDCSKDLKSQLPHSALTLHRWLGAKPPSPYFKHDASHPLISDVVVVDEASMVDLALMSKLVDALKPDARLILLGDKDQLASVESGAVLADLIAELPNHTVELIRSYRFDDGIKNLAEAVNRQDYATAWALLQVNDESIRLLEPKLLLPYILEHRADYMALLRSETDFTAIYRTFCRFQVLCSNRHGKNGALTISAAVERELFGQQPQAWYPGRPVMVTQNHPALHLYNGDIGICLPDRERNGNLMVFFQHPDGSIKKHLPTRLPNCETVFAMTVHKSQGSEFDEVLIVLPETPNPVLSKELLYTAITRAKNNIKIAGGKPVFDITVNSKVERVTGLLKKIS